MSKDPSARDALTSRVIPQMTLSNVDNPLTAPLPSLAGLPPAERAQARFNVSGNAIITGGSGNLALETARALLDHGLQGLCLFDIAIEQERIAYLTSEFPSAKIIVKKVDVTNADAVNVAVDETAQELGGVHIMLCFAGIVDSVHAEEMKPESWRRVLDVNTTGAWLCAQAAGKHMIAQKIGGRIVLTASVSAHRANFPQPQVAYNASKGALLMLTQSLAAEWAVHGITVNTVSPGYMDTILNEGPGLDVLKKEWFARNPMGRMGAPEELAGVMTMLCGRAGRYINGADIMVDGGQHVF